MKRILVFVLVFSLLTFNVSALDGESESLKSGEASFSLMSEITLSQDYSPLKERVLDTWNKVEKEVNAEDLELGFDIDELTDFLTDLYYSNPRLFYVSTTFKYFYNEQDNTLVGIEFYYRTDDKDEIKKTLEAIDAETDYICSLVNGNMTDFQKVMTVHDYMVKAYHYDMTYTNYSASIMSTKTGVCAAYSAAFNIVMRRLGIESKYINSEAMNHGWNLVKVDGKWYHIDLTGDDPSPDRFGFVSYNNALLSTQKISEDHKGFDMGSIDASSTLYDNADWRESSGMCFYGKKMYYVKNNKLIAKDENGATTVIYSNIPSEKWYIEPKIYFTDTLLCSIGEYNGRIYFNTDDKILCYNTWDKTVSTVATGKYYTGFFIDRNILHYASFDRNIGNFIESGSIALEPVRIGETFFSGKTAQTAFCVSDSGFLYYFIRDGRDIDVKAFEKGVHFVDEPYTSSPKLYFLNKVLCPFIPIVEIPKK